MEPGGLAIWHWIIVAMIVLPTVFASTRILRRMGFSRWWAVLTFFPFLFQIGLIILAAVRWPLEGQRPVGPK